MAASDLCPQTLEERVVYWSIISTWVVWAAGGLYLLAPVVGWSLLAIAMTRRLGLSRTKSALDKSKLPRGCSIWVAGMSTMAVCLLIGHADFNLGVDQTIKSLLGWMKGWALMAVFIYIGATMHIRPAVMYRATNKLGAQTLLLVPIFILAAFVHAQRPLYVSPLQFIGGPGPEFFTVELYGIEPESGAPRWRFFAPWAPAAAFVSNISFVFALYEKNIIWKTVGILSSLVVCLMTQSRMGLIAIPAVSFLTLTVSNVTRSFPLFTATAICMSIMPFIDAVTVFITDSIQLFQNARASSSRVRSALQRIAIHRWWNEAPVWGHGIVERGSHLVEYMPIGSHHTWNGLLYVKGSVGLFALAVPMACTFLELAIKAQTDRVARAGLGVILAVIFYSFGENLEILAYLIWPGLIVTGTAMKRPLVKPFHSFMGRSPGRV